jgi:hypothetical protein
LAQLVAISADIKVLSPQVWLDGELLGGLDIMKEMHENGELVTTLPVKQSLNTRLKNLIDSHKVYYTMICTRMKNHESLSEYSLV